MKKIKELYFESYLFYIFNNIKKNLVHGVKSSFLKRLWIWFNTVFMKTVPMRILFDPEYVSSLWYKSFFYRYTTLKIRKLSYYLPKPSISFNNSFIGIFIFYLLFFPDKLWSDMAWILLLSAISLFYILCNIRNRAGTIFTLVNIVMIMLVILSQVAMPSNMLLSSIYLLAGIDIFFLISLSVKNLNDLENLLEFLFIAAFFICFIGIIQTIFLDSVPTSVFNDGIRLGEILILIFPFTMVYSLEFVKGKRKIIYSAFIFIMFFNVINQTQSKAALIGFIVEILILVVADIKFLPSLIILMPFGLSTLIENIRQTWYAATSYGNIINNIISLFTDIWRFGFGVNSKKFLDIYNIPKMSQEGSSFLQIPNTYISSFYINLISNISAILMVGFMAYILRLAHSAFTMMFTGEKRYRRLFVASLATLVAISVSSFFETTIFASRSILIYWVILGIVRSVRIMNLGVYES